MHKLDLECLPGRLPVCLGRSQTLRRGGKQNADVIASFRCAKCLQLNVTTCTVKDTKKISSLAATKQQTTQKERRQTYSNSCLSTYNSMPTNWLRRAGGMEGGRQSAAVYGSWWLNFMRCFINGTMTGSLVTQKYS